MPKKDFRNGLDWDVFVRDEYKCVYCGLDLRAVGNLRDRWDLFVADHLIPNATKPWDSVLNLVTACMGCNRLKSKFDPAKELGIDLTEKTQPDLIEAAKIYIAKQRLIWLPDVLSMLKEIDDK